MDIYHPAADSGHEDSGIIEADPFLYKTNEPYRNSIHKKIAGYLERDWFDQAQDLANQAGVTENKFEQLVKKYKPNAELVG